MRLVGSILDPYFPVAIGDEASFGKRTVTGDPIQRLIRELSKLPGIGQKTATRLAFFVLRAPTEQAQSLARALVEVKDKIRLCSVYEPDRARSPRDVQRSSPR